VNYSSANGGGVCAFPNGCYKKREMDKAIFRRPSFTICCSSEGVTGWISSPVYAVHRPLRSLLLWLVDLLLMRICLLVHSKNC